MVPCLVPIPQMQLCVVYNAKVDVFKTKRTTCLNVAMKEFMIEVAIQLLMYLLLHKLPPLTT